MKEVDSISRLKVELERKDNLERQLQIAESPVERLLRETRRLERIVPKSPLAMGRLYMEDSSIALIEGIARTCREGEKAQALRMHDAILQAKAAYTSRTEMMMESMRSAVEMARSQFASQGLLTFGAIKPIDDRWLRGLESASSRIAEVARINYAITEIALLHWNAKALAARAPLLEDCVFNLAALETFHAAAIVPDATISPERLGLAADFVFEHSEVVRHLPPQLPREDSEPEDGQARAEEIGAKLETALRAIDRRLLDLRRKAWRNMAGGSVAGARLAMAGIRELFDEVLRIFAPDDVVAATPEWKNRTNPELLKLAKPTRRMRIAYLVGDAKAAEADALFQLEKSIKHTQGFVHAFADDPELVRGQMCHMEIWIHLLVHYGVQRSRSN